MNLNDTVCIEIQKKDIISLHYAELIIFKREGMLVLYIDGKWVQSMDGKTFAVINPATGETLGQVADGGQEDTKLAIEAAHCGHLHGMAGSRQRRSFAVR